MEDLQGITIELMDMETKIGKKLVISYKKKYIAYAFTKSTLPKILKAVETGVNKLLLQDVLPIKDNKS